MQAITYIWKIDPGKHQARAISQNYSLVSSLDLGELLADTTHSERWQNQEYQRVPSQMGLFCCSPHTLPPKGAEE